jgi:hypothetical protein
MIHFQVRHLMGVLECHQLINLYIQISIAKPSKVEPSKVEPSKECAWVRSCEHEQQAHYYRSSAPIYRKQKRDIDQIAQIQQDWMGK